MIWVNGDLVEVYNEDWRRNVGVKTNIKYVRDTETGRYHAEGKKPEHVVQKLSFKKKVIGLILRKQERRSKTVGVRPFSVDYGIDPTDPLANDIHEIASDGGGYAYEFQKPDGEDYIKPVLVAVPKKFVSLSPTDHRRFFASGGGKNSASSGRRVGS